MLIDRGRIRITEFYTEIHHIIPRCMGGSNDKTNLVSLTPEEHFVAHQLLVKIYPNNPKLVYAVRMMCFGNRRSNKLYGWIKRRYSNERTLFKYSDLSRKKMSESRGHYGRRFGPHLTETKRKISKAITIWMTDEVKQNQSLKMSGRVLTEEHKNKISEKAKLRTNSEETRRKISEANKGRIISEDARRKSSETQSGKKQEIISCPHCSKIGGRSNMLRYHFNNCKVRNNNDLS